MNAFFFEQEHVTTPRFSEIGEANTITTIDSPMKQKSGRSECLSISPLELSNMWQFTLKKQPIVHQPSRKLIILFEHVLYGYKLATNKVPHSGEIDDLKIMRPGITGFFERVSESFQIFIISNLKEEFVCDLLEKCNIIRFVKKMCTGDFQQLSRANDFGLKFFQKVLRYRPNKTILLTVKREPSFGLERKDIMYIDPYAGEHSDRHLDELIPALKAYLNSAEGEIASGGSIRSLESHTNWAKKDAQANWIDIEDAPFEDCNPVGALLRGLDFVNQIKTKRGLDR